MPLNVNTELTYLENKKYSYEIMKKQMHDLVRQYPFLTLYKVGKSVQNRAIYCLRLGQGHRKIHINGSHHANEWITSIVIMKSIELICKLIQNNQQILGSPAADLLKRITYDFVPMVNPDGVELCVNGLAKDYNLTTLKEINEGQLDFSRWKANIRGVDLNRNYNAGFEAYKLISEKSFPSYAYYAGSSPESEPETKALAALTRKQEYNCVFAYHTQGEVIYWTYKDFYIKNARKYAKMFSKASGYSLDVPEPTAASGGYKDWFILQFKKPGFTIECGYGENPIDAAQTDEIVNRTLPIVLLASRDLREEE